MKVSIVIPAHNEEKYIRKTIEAALAQTYPDVEVVVVDNASTDNTANIAREFPTVKFVQEPRKGSQYSRERGRVEATGEIIASLDADTIPDREWVARVVPYFKDPNVVALGGGVSYFDGSWPLNISAFIIQNTFYKFFHFILQSLHVGGVMIASNVFIRADSLARIGGYETSILFYGDDTDTAKRLTTIGKVLFKPSISIKSSARRFNAQGLIRTFYLYLINFFWVTFFRKPFSQPSQKINKKNPREV